MRHALVLAWEKPWRTEPPAYDALILIAPGQKDTTTATTVVPKELAQRAGHPELAVEGEQGQRC